MKQYVAILAGLLLLAPTAVRAATNPAGVWEGILKTPTGDLGLVIDLHRDGDKWAVSGLPLANVKVDGAAIGFPIHGPGDLHYDGKLSEDGKSISGNLTPQGGQSIPLDLKWKSESRAVEKVPPANTSDVQVLEGVWEGALDANGNQIQLRFNFTENADGSITRMGDTVKMDMKAVGGSYEGTLNKDASAMAGTFSQRGVSLPLNMQRKKAEKKN